MRIVVTSASLVVTSATLVVTGALLVVHQGRTGDVVLTHAFLLHAGCGRLQQEHQSKLLLLANIVTTSKAPVTTSVALVTTSNGTW